jgi:hypothetical protein
MPRFVKKYAPLFVLSLVFVLAGVVLFPAAGRDDAYITAWAATALARYGKILNVNLEPVEQSSSLAQVLLMAAVVKITSWPAILVGRLVSIFFGVLGLWLIWLEAGRRFGESFSKAQGVAAGLIAANITYAYWSFGGLETTLAAVGWMGYLMLHHRFRAGGWRWGILFPLIPILLIRPESTLLALGAAGLSLLLALITDFRNRKLNNGVLPEAPTELRWLLTNAAAVTAIFLARLLAFGQIFPQPVVAKTNGLSLTALMSGLTYLAQELVSFPFIGVGLLAVLGVVVVVKRWIDAPSEQQNLDLLPLLSTGLAFIAFTGGDWMEGARFLVPFLPFVVLLAVEGVRSFQKRGYQQVILAGCVLLQAAGAVSFLNTSSTSIPLFRASPAGLSERFQGSSFLERNNGTQVRDLLFVPELESWIDRMIAYKGAPITIMSGQMGMVVTLINEKYAGQVLWMDRNALVERTFTNCEVSRAWERDETGRLRVYYKPFNKSLDALKQQCGISKPDMVFELGKFEGQADNQGFDIVFAQRGSIGVGLFEDGNTIDLSQFIAINDEYRKDFSAPQYKAIEKIYNNGNLQSILNLEPSTIE